MKKIYKYHLSQLTIQNIKIPKGAEILTTQIQNGRMCIWAIVNPDNPLEIRSIEIIPTGVEIHEDMGVDRKYISTIQMVDDNLDFHIFERL